VQRGTAALDFTQLLSRRIQQGEGGSEIALQHPIEPWSARARSQQVSGEGGDQLAAEDGALGSVGNQKCIDSLLRKSRGHRQKPGKRHRVFSDRVGRFDAAKTPQYIVLNGGQVAVAPPTCS